MSDAKLLTRRSLMQGGLIAATGMFGVPTTAATRTVAESSAPTVLQIVDAAPHQQDVAKDFLNGALAAWQEGSGLSNARARTVVHRKVEINTDKASWWAPLEVVLRESSVVALSGTVSERAAQELRHHMATARLQLPHVAPWLHDIDRADEYTFPIFANRQMQMIHALKSLSIVGVKEVGAIYASAADRELYHDSVDRAASSMGLKLKSFTGTGDARALGQVVGAQVPAVNMFLGGTPELARFTQGLADQEKLRYVIAMADVNLQILRQMGASPRVPVIAAQVVPLTRSSAPLVIAYRQALARLFDEPASSLSLAGYVAARYTQQVLSSISGPIDRVSVRAAFSRRQAFDLGGFRVAYDERGLGGAYVTQSMLSAEGREIG